MKSYDVAKWLNRDASDLEFATTFANLQGERSHPLDGYGLKDYTKIVGQMDISEVESKIRYAVNRLKSEPLEDKEEVMTGAVLSPSTVSTWLNSECSDKEFLEVFAYLQQAFTSLRGGVVETAYNEDYLKGLDYDGVINKIMDICKAEKSRCFLLERNFTIEEVNDHNFLVRSDSLRFGEQAIVYQDISRQKCLEYIAKHENNPVHYYVIKDLSTWNSQLNPMTRSSLERFDCVEDALRRYQEYRDMAYNKEPLVTSEGRDATRLALGLSVEGKSYELDLIHVRADRAYFLSDVFTDPTGKISKGVLTNTNFLHDLKKIMDTIQVDGYSYYTKDGTNVLADILPAGAEVPPNDIAYRVKIHAGRVTHNLTEFPTEEEAKEFCETHDYEWMDENEFVWDLSYEEVELPQRVWKMNYLSDKERMDEPTVSFYPLDGNSKYRVDYCEFADAGVTRREYVVAPNEEVARQIAMQRKDVKTPFLFVNQCYEAKGNRLIALRDGTDMGGELGIFSTNAPRNLLERLQKESNKVYILGGDVSNVPVWGTELEKHGYDFRCVDTYQNVTAYGTATDWMEAKYPQITEQYVIENQPVLNKLLASLPIKKDRQAILQTHTEEVLGSLEGIWHVLYEINSAMDGQWNNPSMIQSMIQTKKELLSFMMEAYSSENSTVGRASENYFFQMGKTVLEEKINNDHILLPSTYRHILLRENLMEQMMEQAELTHFDLQNASYELLKDMFSHSNDNTPAFMDNCVINALRDTILNNPSLLLSDGIDVNREPIDFELAFAGADKLPQFEQKGTSLVAENVFSHLKQDEVRDYIKASMQNMIDLPPIFNYKVNLNIDRTKMSVKAEVELSHGNKSNVTGWYMNEKEQEVVKYMAEESLGREITPMTAKESHAKPNKPVSPHKQQTQERESKKRDVGER